MRKTFTAGVLIVLFSMGLIFPGSAVAEDDYYIKKSGWSLTKEGGTLTIETTQGFNEFQEYYAFVETLEALIIGPRVEKLEFDYKNVQVQPERIIVDPENKNLFVEGGVLYDRKNRSAILIETTVEKIVFREDTVSIGPSAAEDRTGLKEVTFPVNLESIGRGAFSWCGLKALVLPPALKTIDWFAFECNKELESVIFQQDALELGGAVFDGCIKLKAVVLPQNLEKILAKTFRNCESLEHIDLPESLVFIENSAFEDCKNLKELTLREGMRTISGSAFSGRRFRMIHFPCDISITGWIDSDKPYECEYCFGIIQTVVFEGDFSLGDYAIEGFDQLIALGAPPKSIPEKAFARQNRDGIDYLFDMYGHYTKPTIYFLDEYAEYWAPNGETTWNGFALRQITRGEAEAMIAEAAQPTPTPSPTPTPKATLGPRPTLSPTSTPRLSAAPEQEGGDWVAYLLIGGIIVVAAGVVVLAVAGRKKR